MSNNAGPIYVLPLPTPWYLSHTDTITAFTAGASTRTANATYLFGITNNTPVVVTGFSIAHGAVASGNLDMGIYDSNGNLLVHTGVTGAANANGTQTINLTTPYILAPGIYYLAFWVDNATDTYFARGGVPANAFMQIVNGVGTNAGGLAINFAGMGGVSGGGTFVPFIARLQGGM